MKIQKMINPFTQFKFAFELWVASVFGIYSQDFYDWNEWIFTVPKYTQENLTGRFWQDLNEGWEDMEYNFKFEDFWGEGAKPETIILSQTDYVCLQKRLAEPPDPKVVERFREILNKPAPWDA